MARQRLDAERRALARLGVEPPALEAEEQIRIEELAALGELRSAVKGALAELGHDLRAAWARPPRRPLLARWPRGVVLVLALLALVPTALATRDAIWAPDPVPLPDAARPPGSVAPERTGAQVYVATGVERGVAWRLTASACDYARVRAVGVFPRCPGAGEGRAATSRRGAPGSASARPSSPSAWCRRTSTRCPAGTWAFGVVPAAARTVDVTGAAASTRVAATPADPDAVAKGGLPAGMRVFVAVLDGARDVPLVTVRDGAGAALLVCREGRCAPPSPRRCRCP